jgi:hypothetical protein
MAACLRREGCADAVEQIVRLEGLGQVATGSRLQGMHTSHLIGIGRDCGNPERHEYELYLAIENIDHSRTKTKSPQTNGICERFHKTMLDEFYRVAFRKKLYHDLAELQADLDQWLRQYNEVRTHQGRWCYGKTPMQTFLDSLPVAREKLIDQQSQPVAAIC